MRPPKTTAVIACLLAACAAAPAAASTGQPTIMQDDGQLLNRGADVRNAALDEMKALGADVVKLQLPWANIAPGGARRPDGFRGWELSSYAEAAWAPYDHAISAAQQRGLRVLLAVSLPAPGWATRQRGDGQGVYRPDAREFGRFFRAVGTRYDGAHGEGRVEFWSISNEPNHPDFLQPLGSRRGTLYAPRIYRDMVRNAVAGLRLSGHAGDTTLFGELLPIGQSRTGPRNSIRPVAFLREFFCLDRRLRPYRGSTARRHGCSSGTRVSGVDGFAYHPYTRPGGPRVREAHADDATVRSLGRITRVLDRASSLRRLDRRRMRVYVTEFAYQSDPPDPFQTPLGRIPAYLNEAEWIAWRNGRVATWSQYALVDDALRGNGSDRFSGFQSGLRFEDGSAKPGVYDAFALPLFVRLRGSSSVEVWGAARGGGPGSRITIEQRIGSGSWTRLKEVAVGNRQGYFRERVRISRASKRSFRVVAGERMSRTTKAARR